MSNITVLYVGNDTILQVEGLRNDVSGAFLNAATVTVSLRDASGNGVAGDTWPKVLTYVTNSKGIYRTTLPYSLVLAVDQEVTAEIIADAGPGLRAAWTLPCVARTRE